MPPPQPSATHYRGIDALRGLAALAVAAAHIPQTAFPAAFRAHANVWTTLGAFGVSLFFVISGFCIHMGALRREASGAPSIDRRTFFTRRLVRLYPAHLVVLVLSVATAGWVAVPSNAETLLSTTTPAQFVAHLCMAHTFWRDAYYSGNAVLWSLALETHFYLAYPLLLFLRSRWGMTRTLLVLLGISIVIALCSRVAPEALWRLSRNALARWWEWGLGCLTAEYVVRHPRTFEGTRRFGAVIAPGALLVIGNLILGMPGGALLRAYAWPVGFSLAIVEACRVSVESRTPLWRALLACGVTSYSLYLVHPIAYHLALVGVGETAGWVLRIVALAATAGGMTWLFYWAIERPTMRMAARIR